MKIIAMLKELKSDIHILLTLDRNNTIHILKDIIGDNDKLTYKEGCDICKSLELMRVLYKQSEEHIFSFKHINSNNGKISTSIDNNIHILYDDYDIVDIRDGCDYVKYKHLCVTYNTNNIRDPEYETVILDDNLHNYIMYKRTDGLTVILNKLPYKIVHIY